MSRLTDQELIEELKARFDMNRKALHDLQALTAQLEKMNRRLQESEAMKSHFLSNIRNEINNPLTSIMGLSRHLMAGKCEPGKVAEVGGMVFSEAFDLDFQLRNIFIAAELEAGERRPDYAHVDIGSLIASTVDMLAHQIDAKVIRLTQHFEMTAPLHFTTDAQMLQVALVNLLVNAVEYSHQGGEVSISAELTASELKIIVTDSGVGIDPADHERIFDRFRQMESGATKSHRGHGLGLSIIKAVVELLDGRVMLESDLGQGARFTLILPVPTVDTPVNVQAQDGNFFLFKDEEGEGEVF
jgi:signal transduction histidine kinase